VEILKRAVAVSAAFDIDHAHRCARRSVMDARAAQVEIVAWIAAAERDVLAGLGQRVLDHGAGKADAPIRALYGPRTGKVFNPAWGCVGKTDGFKRLERGFVEAVHLNFGQGLVPTTFHTGAY